MPTTLRGGVSLPRSWGRSRWWRRRGPRREPRRTWWEPSPPGRRLATDPDGERMRPRLTSPRSRCSIRRTTLAVTAAVGALSAGACGSQAAPPPQTVRVERGSVSSLGSPTLGSPRGGQLPAGDAKVGDRVPAGQVLATIDDFAARRQLQ